jgi:hypothetical protein
MFWLLRSSRTEKDEGNVLNRLKIVFLQKCLIYTYRKPQSTRSKIQHLIYLYTYHNLTHCKQITPILLQQNTHTHVKKQRVTSSNRASVDRSSKTSKAAAVPRERSLLRMLVTGIDPLLHKMLVVGDGFLMHRLLREGGPSADSIARVFLTDPLGTYTI